MFVQDLEGGVGGVVECPEGGLDLLDVGLRRSVTHVAGHHEAQMICD